MERHSLSRFLVNAYFHREKRALRIVSEHTLTDELLSTLNLVRQEVGYEVLIIELTNEFNIPAYCACLRNSPFFFEIVGFGCSLLKSHAVKRSLYELAQCFHITTQLYPTEFSEQFDERRKKLANFGLLLNCSRMKICELKDRIGFVNVSYLENCHGEYVFDLDEYLLKLNERFRASQRRVFSSVIAQLPEGQCLTHSFFDSQDRFFGVVDGHVVFPNSL